MSGFADELFKSCDVNSASEGLVLIGYASLMESVQRFEWALKRLAVQRDESLEDLPFDEAWRRAEKLLRKPLEGLEHVISEELSQRFPELKRIRNQLAHEVLLRWRLETNVGLVTNNEVVESFAELANEFDLHAENVDLLADQTSKDRGIDPSSLEMSADELRSIIKDHS